MSEDVFTPFDAACKRARGLLAAGKRREAEEALAVATDAVSRALGLAPVEGIYDEVSRRLRLTPGEPDPDTPESLGLDL